MDGKLIACTGAATSASDFGGSAVVSCVSELGSRDSRDRGRIKVQCGVNREAVDACGR